MPSIARTSTEFSDNHVEDDQFDVHGSDDFDDSPAAPSTSLVSSAGDTGPEATSHDTDEHNNNSRGRSARETEHDEHRPSTTGERDEPLQEVASQSPARVEESSNGSDDDSTVVGGVNDGNHPGRYAEHRRLSVVEVNYEDMATPELSVGNDEDDSHSEFAHYESDEDEGPMAIEHVEGGAPYVSVMGVVVPVDQSRRRKRTRDVLEDEDGDDVPRMPMAGSTAISALEMLANVAADAPRAPKRARHTHSAVDNVEHGNLALRLRQSGFGEHHERLHRPLRSRANDAYAYAVGLGSEVRLDPDHASLLGAPTPVSSPTGWRSPTNEYVDEEDTYESKEEDEEEYGDEEEYEEKDDEHADEDEDEEQVRDDELATQLPATVVEVGEEESEADE